MEQFTSITYCKGWLRPKRKRAKIYTLEEARNLYNEGSIYYATFENLDQVIKFIIHNKGFFYVGFLDALQREYLKYQFQQSARYPDKLFLKEVQYWEYEGESDKKIQTDIYQFTENGDITIHKVNVQTREGTQFTSAEPFEISGFYEDFPEFGEYDKLIRKDRIDSLTLSDDNFKPIG